MTKEEAQKRIQELLTEVKQLADEHKVEFSFCGATMHYAHTTGIYVDDKYTEVTVYADNGLLVSDAEWESSNCYGPIYSWEEREIYPKIEQLEKQFEGDDEA